ncbi:hypothetical protein [Blastococcus sp. Marseille-P5729]|uniref:hypothetical protein n=1 Tax=Blastococcus sp. Marseille-P5729 TaxID=2086582 RepID=UPI000D10CAF7|nr:hypothetical protein [Blastococcus sp. Marseille-P5729]
MTRHTDFTRLGGTSQPAQRRRRDARAALFSETAASEPDGPPAGVLQVDDANGVAAPSGPRTGDDGWFLLSCSSCRTQTRMGLLGIMCAAVPSLHLPLLKWRYPSLMRCPDCRRHRWVSVSLAL